MKRSLALRNWCLAHVKHWLALIGTVTPRWAILMADESLNYLETSRWLTANGYRVPRRVKHRDELFDLIGREVGERDVLYLEFGVYYGESLRYWSKVLKSPRSVLHGFDSFEGLPQPWKDNAGKGSFSTGGAVPEFDDPRVRLFIGRFEDVLPAYEAPAMDAVVINIDCDTYESTACVLTRFRHGLVKGAYLYFDEFCFRGHELRAFQEFVGGSGLEFRLRGIDRTLHNAVFQVV